MNQRIKECFRAAYCSKLIQILMFVRMRWYTFLLTPGMIILLWFPKIEEYIMDILIWCENELICNPDKTEFFH